MCCQLHIYVYKHNVCMSMPVCVLYLPEYKLTPVHHITFQEHTHTEQNFLQNRLVFRNTASLYLSVS